MANAMNNMKTKAKAKHHAVSAPGADNNNWRLYEVNLHRTFYYETNVCVKATSPEQAKNIAEKRAKGLNDDEWTLVDRDLFAFEAKPMRKGGVVETLQDAEAFSLTIPNPQDNQPQEDED